MKIKIIFWIRNQKFSSHFSVCSAVAPNEQRKFQAQFPLIVDESDINCSSTSSLACSEAFILDLIDSAFFLSLHRSLSFSSHRRAKTNAGTMPTQRRRLMSVSQALRTFKTFANDFVFSSSRASFDMKNLSKKSIAAHFSPNRQPLHVRRQHFPLQKRKRRSSEFTSKIEIKWVPIWHRKSDIGEVSKWVEREGEMNPYGIMSRP